jgi:hypothetical protein
VVDIPLRQTRNNSAWVGAARCRQDRIGSDTELDHVVGGDPARGERRATAGAALGRELERQGVHVGVPELAREVGADVGKVIEWTG